MGIFRKKENRALDAAAIDPTLQALICTDDRITAEEAIQVPMVAACVEWISGTVARLPVQLFRKDGETVTELTDDPRVKLLNRETGDLLDAYQLKKAWCRHSLCSGRDEAEDLPPPQPECGHRNIRQSSAWRNAR